MRVNEQTLVYVYIRIEQMWYFSLKSPQCFPMIVKELVDDAEDGLTFSQQGDQGPKKRLSWQQKTEGQSLRLLEEMFQLFNNDDERKWLLSYQNVSGFDLSIIQSSHAATLHLDTY